MLKKAIPFVLLSGLALGACGVNNDTVPKKNETPMENMEDRERDWTPNARDEQRGGVEMDGLDDNRDMNNSGVKDGIINQDSTTHPNDDGIRENGTNGTNGINGTNGTMNDEVVPGNNSRDR